MRTLILLIIIAANSCVKTGSNTIIITGELNKQGITTYQYGTHTISDGKTTFALKSATIDLQKFEGKKVTVHGNKVEGYPLEGGPDYLEVTKVE